MKYYGFFKYLMFSFVLFVFTGCGIKFYTPSHSPLAVKNANNTIVAGIGSPGRFEYQKKLSGKLDFVINYGNASGKKTENSVELNTSYSAGFAGAKYWLTGRKMTGTGIALFAGVDYMQNDETDVKWTQMGPEIGILPGFYSESVTVAFPVRAGFGSVTTDDGGNYSHRSIGVQVFGTSSKFTGGLTVEAILGNGDLNKPDGTTFDLKPIPVSTSLFLAYLF